MKKVNYGMGTIDYSHWIIITTIHSDTKLLDNEIKMYLERTENISISKCKDIDPLVNGKRRLAIDLATEENYHHFLKMFARTDTFFIQKQRVFMSGEGIAHDEEQVRRIVTRLKGKLYLANREPTYGQHSISSSRGRGGRGGMMMAMQQQEEADEFTALYESLVTSSSNYESNLRKEVGSILNDMYPNSSSSTMCSTSTEMTNNSTGNVRRF